MGRFIVGLILIVIIIIIITLLLRVNHCDKNPCDEWCKNRGLWSDHYVEQCRGG